MFDVFVHGRAPDVAPVKRRAVFWSRSVFTREGVLHFLRSYDVCRDLLHNRCIVSHNNRIWPLQDVAERRVITGDYFRVDIPPQDAGANFGVYIRLWDAERGARAQHVFNSGSERRDDSRSSDDATADDTMPSGSDDPDDSEHPSDTQPHLGQLRRDGATMEVDDRIGPHRISLLDALAPEAIYKPYHDAPTVEEAFELEFASTISLLQWMDACIPFPAWDLPEGHVWKPSSLSWTSLQWWNYEQPDSLHFYTDGSAKDDRGWQHYVIKDYGATPTMPFYRTIDLQPCFLVLHMFSGRRRSTDLHAALEKMTASLPYSVHVLSCDTAIDEHYGNLLGTGHSWRQIEELLKKGMISCCVSGAPCETFTEARHWLPDDPGLDTSQWPRPLRSSDWPWGLEGLVPRELLQLGVGSSFSLQTLWVMANLLRVGGTMLSEHPAPPRLPERASIFTTPLARLMRTLPEIFLHILPQGWWGAKSKKPTGLLTLRLPRLKASMYKWRLDEIPTEYEMAIGKTASGSFKTASLKEYPCRFSFGMAHAIVDDLSSKVRQGHVRPAPEKLPPATELWVDKLLEISSLIRTDATMQADFQPERM